MIKNSHIHLFPSTVFADDSFQREVSQTTIAYNALGDRESVTDASGETTRYAYDAFGRNIAITNALGIATIYEYDARGNKTYEGGGTYPVSYAYDAYNVMTNMTTYRAPSRPRATPRPGSTTRRRGFSSRRPTPTATARLTPIPTAATLRRGHGRAAS